MRRDTHEKITVSLDEINEKVAELLGTIQHDMLERAKAHRELIRMRLSTWKR